MRVIIITYSATNGKGYIYFISLNLKKHTQCTHWISFFFSFSFVSFCFCSFSSFFYVALSMYHFQLYESRLPGGINL